MHITESELGAMTSMGGLTVGNSENSIINVNAIFDVPSSQIGTMTLLATKQARVVVFETFSSLFNKGVIVQAMGGIVLSESVTTKASPTDLIAGTGWLTIVAGKVLATTNQQLSITADDLDFQPDAAVSSGSASTNIYSFTPGTTIGLGNTGRDMTLSGLELQMLYATGVKLGDTNCGSITIDGVSEASSNNILATLTLLANRDDAFVVFTGAQSTFNALSLQADNGINLQAGVFTDFGDLILDGDLDNSSTEDSHDGIVIKVDTTVSAKLQLVMDSTNNGIVASGAATLQAGRGILVNDNFYGSGGTLVFNTDYESGGDGTLTVVASKIVQTGEGSLIISTFDMEVVGDISAGASVVRIFGASDGQTMGVGTTARQMHISDMELGRITATGGISVGGPQNGFITVSGLSDSNTDMLGTVYLMATKASQVIIFESAVSTFNKGIIAQAASGVIFTENVITTSSQSLIIAGTVLDGRIAVIVVIKSGN